MAGFSPAPLPSLSLVLGERLSLTAEQGSISVSGQAAGLTYGSSAVPSSPAPLPHLGLLGGLGFTALVANSGSFAITGQDAGFLRGLRVTADAGFYTLTGQPALFERIVATAGDPAPLPHIGLLLQFVSSARTLTADAGIYAITGSDGLIDIEMSAAQGSITITGQAAGMLKTSILVAEVGSYAISGQDATFNISSPARTMPADTQTYTVSGQAAGMLAQRMLLAEQGFYSLQGQAANLVYGVTNAYTMLAEQGSYTTFGNDQAFVFGGAVLEAGYGTYQLDGGAAFVGPVAATGGGGGRRKKKLSLYINGKRYLGTQEEFERLATAAFTSAPEAELPAISVQIDKKHHGDDDLEARELEAKLKKLFKEIQRRAREKSEDEEILEFL